MSNKTRSLINALRVLDSEIQSEDGVANAVVAEAATRLEEQQERIKRLEEMYEGEIGENHQFLGSNLQGLLTRELNWSKDRIKRLEEAGNEMCSEFKAFCPLGAKTRDKWRKAKEAKP